METILEIIGYLIIIAMFIGGGLFWTGFILMKYNEWRNKR